MDQFALLGSVAIRIQAELRTVYYLLLPVFFAASLVLAWFKHPQGGPDFIEAVKRAFIATLLMVGFTEITDIILFLANGLAAKIDDMSGLNTIMQMAGEKAKSYTLSPYSLVLQFDDLVVSVLAYLSYIVLYFARFIMVALYHFSWIFLSIIAPIILLFHMFSPKLTVNLFRSMAEVACWKIVWAVLSAMLAALPFGNAFAADGNYLTVMVLNFVIALCMLGTPLVVHSLVGAGLSGMTGALAPAVAGVMLAAPAKAAAVHKVARGVFTDTKGFATHYGGKTLSGISSAFQGRGGSSPPPPSTPAPSSPSTSAASRAAPVSPRESAPPPKPFKH